MNGLTEVATFVLTALCMIITGAIAYGKVVARAVETDKRVTILENGLRHILPETLAADIATMKTDIAWIKRELERKPGG